MLFLLLNTCTGEKRGRETHRQMGQKWGGKGERERERNNYHTHLPRCENSLKEFLFFLVCFPQHFGDQKHICLYLELFLEVFPLLTRPFNCFLSTQGMCTWHIFKMFKSSVHNAMKYLCSLLFFQCLLILQINVCSHRYFVIITP